MKRLLFIALAVAVVGWVATPARAFVFEQGENLGKLADWGSFYDPTTHAAKKVGDFAEGDWDNTLFRITQLFEPPDEIPANQYYNGLSPELDGLFYDLKIKTVTPISAGIFQIDLKSAGRYGDPYVGGRVDVWQDAANNLTPAGSGGYPNDWGFGAPGGAGWADYPFDAGEFDTFPTATDGTATPLLSGTLVSPDGSDVLLSLFLNFNLGTGSTSQGFIHVLDNYSSTPFAPVYLGGQAEIAFFNNFKFWPNSSLRYEPTFDNPNTTKIYWATASEDPINFKPVPEPATCLLLGSGLIGLLGAFRRRRQ
jgi:hypothetical protein